MPPPPSKQWTLPGPCRRRCAPSVEPPGEGGMGLEFLDLVAFSLGQLVPLPI